MSGGVKHNEFLLGENLFVSGQEWSPRKRRLEKIVSIASMVVMWGVNSPSDIFFDMFTDFVIRSSGWGEMCVWCGRNRKSIPGGPSPFMCQTEQCEVDAGDQCTNTSGGYRSCL